MTMFAEADIDLSTPMHVHVVGVGGAGMSAIASVLATMGHTVSGSDLKSTSVTSRLGAQGIRVSIGHAAQNVLGSDLVTFSPAVASQNPELVAASEAGIRIVGRERILAVISTMRRSIAVGGTHGKTTTSSMLSLILVQAGLKPSFLIGAEVNEIGTNAVWDDGDWLVIEADESFGTFRSLKPDIAVLTNVEPDHLDYYSDFGALRSAFGEFLAAGKVQACVSGDDPIAFELGKEHGALSVGTGPDMSFHMDDIVLRRSSLGFNLTGPRGLLGRIEMPVPGMHNARNAALATVASLSAGATFSDAQRALARFAGVSRRFEFRGSSNGVTFVDDYAHLPTEVKAALTTARDGQFRRVIAVFQPHRYTRTQALARTFGTAFSQADLVFVTDVYSAGEQPIPGVSGRLVLDAIESQDPDRVVVYAPNRAELLEQVLSALEPGDLCVTLGAGDLTTLSDSLQES